VVSLELSTWQESILLQVADFMAYENSNVIVSIEAGKAWRRSIKDVVDGNNFGCRLAGQAEDQTFWRSDRISNS
jgi:hypothetical protein